MKKEEKVPFVDEVRLFNHTFGKLNNHTPTIPSKADADFVYNFILEEADELREAYEKKDIAEILDAILDLQYVAIGMAAMTFGLRDKIVPGFAEVQASNMSKFCKTEEEAKQTVEKRSIEQREPCHYNKLGDIYIVYRTRDRKIMKSLSYFKPNLSQFFTQEEFDNCKK